jgi:cytochrome oxidase Cu insertion factor (SCO1/SenC/PrrC family)
MKRLPVIALSLTALLAVGAAGVFWEASVSRVENETGAPGQRESESLAQSETETGTPEDADSEAPFGGAFSLTDQNGMRRTDMDFRGKYMLIFFGYTFCPDVCPTTLAVEAEALGKLGESANRIQPIFISVDPKRDTPAKLKTYLASFDAPTRPNFVGLTGTDQEIAEAARAYRVYYRAHIDGQIRDGSGSEYSIDHTGDVYLMDPDGKFVAYYSQGILPDEMAEDLKMKTAPRRSAE